MFVVIFATLLITVVTVSFIRLMVNDQNQASSNDLSQSAYDSAQAGVEDAKRALLRYAKVCNEDGQSACDSLASEINNGDCNEAVRIGDVVKASDTIDGEVRIQQTENDYDSLLQAYTCVKLQLDTDDYVGSLASNESKLVPLVGTSGFNTIKVEWFSADDLSKASAGGLTLDLPGPSASQPLRAQSSWPANRPSVFRTQLMQYGDTFTLGSFDSTSPTGESNANTVFMYPTSAASAPSQDFTARDLRKTTGDTPIDQRIDTPLPIHCIDSLSAGGYACSVTLNLPQPIGGGARTAFLRVTPFYNASHFRVTLAQSGSAVKFNGVQPEIDSTGRANDLFRRVISRVDLIDTNFPYPEAAIDLTGNFCKDFAVTDSTYLAGSCTP